MGVPYGATDGYRRRPEIDVLHYDLALEIGPAGGPIHGRAAILYQAVDTTLTAVSFDLADAMVVDSVTVDGAAVPFRHADGELALETPGTPAGARSQAVVAYHGVPADGLIQGVDRTGARGVFADDWADRARQWFPAIDHPSDKATVAFDVIAPAAWEVVANGRLLGRTDLGDGRAETRWAESAEIPTYCMVIGATDFAVTRAGVVDGVEVSHWAFAADSAAGEAAFARSTEILGFYDSLFGPFPYEKMAYVQSRTKYGGMENASAIFFGQDFVGRAREREGPAADGAASVVAHETVHQWFGDAVTEADWNDVWLSEGFATYFAAVFFEFHGASTGRGPAELARRMAATKPDIFDFERRSGWAVYDPGHVGPGGYEALLDANAYQKGAWVLHMLRHRIGDEAFFGGIRAFYDAFRDGTAWTADLERVMEAASGQDLGWFFAQWVGRPGHPVLAVETAPAGDGRWAVALRQTQPGEPFRARVDLRLAWAGGSRIETVELDGREGRWVFATPAPLASVEVDPGGWLLWEPAPGDRPVP